MILDELARRGARLQAYDPVAMPQAQQALEGVPGITFVADQTAALVGADALLIVTEWREFRSPDFQFIRNALKQPLIFDGRNLFEPAAMQAMGIEYLAIGRGDSVRKLKTP